jgi:hypothetical protein
MVARRECAFAHPTKLLVWRAYVQRLVGGSNEEQPERGEQHRVDEPRQIGQHGLFPGGGLRLDATPPPRVQRCLWGYFARVSASQMPPPIMKPPEIRDTSRVRCLEKNKRALPANSA